MDKRASTSSTESRGSKDSGYSSRPTSSSSQEKSRLQQRNFAISRSFYQLIHGPFYDNPENWANDLQKFKEEVESIEKKYIGDSIYVEISFSWRTLDKVVAEDDGESFNQITTENEIINYSVAALRSIVGSEAAFEKGMIAQVLQEYEEEYKKKKVDLAFILATKDSYSANILHSFTDAAAKKIKLGRKINLLWEIYDQIKEKAPEIADQQDQFKDTPLQTIEHEGITFGEQIW